MYSVHVYAQLARAQDRNADRDIVIEIYIGMDCIILHVGRYLYRADGRDVGCQLDQTSYHKVDIVSIPSSCISVPITVEDCGKSTRPSW